MKNKEIEIDLTKLQLTPAEKLEVAETFMRLKKTFKDIPDDEAYKIVIHQLLRIGHLPMLRQQLLRKLKNE
jgi:predicted metallopeptidase